MNQSASQQAKAARLEELQVTKKHLLECAVEQECLRQAVIKDRTSRGFTHTQYAALFNIGHACIKDFEERIHALGGRGRALECLCQHLAENDRTEQRETAAYYLANTKRIVTLHSRIPSDKVLGIAIFSAPTIQYVFALQEEWVRSGLTRSEFALFFNERIRDLITETLNWNTQTIQTWSQDPPTKSPPDNQEAICAFIQMLENLKTTHFDFEAYRNTLLEQRAETIRAIRQLWDKNLQQIFREKKALRAAMGNPHEATFHDLLSDKDPLEVAGAYSAKTIQAWLQKFTTCVETTPATEAASSVNESQPVVHSPQKADDIHLATEDADVTSDTLVHFVNGLRSFADHAQALTRKRSIKLPPASQHQAKIAIMRLCRVLGIEPHTLIEAQQGQPLDKKTAALLKQ